jgi:hypothetical protein
MHGPRNKKLQYCFHLVAAVLTFAHKGKSRNIVRKTIQITENENKARHKKIKNKKNNNLNGLKQNKGRMTQNK